MAKKRLDDPSPLPVKLPTSTRATPVPAQLAVGLPKPDHKGFTQMARDLSEVRFLTVAEVAEMMRVSKMTVYRLVHSGELPAIRFGRSFRVPESAVEEAIERPVADTA